MKQLIASSVCFSIVAVLSIAARADQKFTCQYGERIREIHVVYESSDSAVPCSVKYKKEDTVQTLWSAESQVGYCEEKAQAFLEKQQGWGWECSQEVGNSVPTEEAASEASVQNDTDASM